MQNSKQQIYILPGFGNQLASSTHFLFAGEIGIIFTSEGCFDDTKFQGFQIISYMRPIYLATWETQNAMHKLFQQTPRSAEFGWASP